MPFLQTLAGYAAPIFLISSPIISYADQAMAMHRKRSSAGFSLDIPLIMLVACMFRIFYWFGAKYDIALLIQAFTNIFMQVILLKIALDHRPSHSSRGGDAALPFAGSQDGFMGIQRPYNFWQWRSPKPYWQFLLYLFITLTVLELIIAPFDSLYPTYWGLLGIIGLGVEATLPIPQLLANARSQSCRGFRLSLLVSWILGDTLKMYWFFTSTTEIPLAFKVCGMFQAGCDLMLGVQYLMYGENEPASRPQQWPYAGMKPHLPRMSSGRSTPTGRRTPLGEKTY
ncbi:hypothetical protein JX265_003892 [Neoarthrinium moseri]|uniref:PQ loop repeat protein n=1 Tax=Neoarthrinium moseri TaxID=1658444 RepID=A0A9P9WRG6_9PEZI|nr:uncharacterized protein JN550_009456 [Neoarthrinium moseri]KAI1853774.1 hypothetical protein JX266_001758 [Neoarthrinium moseri]KAI1863756.1 hypothetical protein JN550_009456 [Neoarthrinium moseri]KAI1876366.1 hypothetical protein JX265_003892 [Neoarthrinium moseri]